MTATWRLDEAGSRPRVSVAGDFDLADEEPFVDGVLASYHDDRRGPLELDLSDLTFIDSSGVRAILRLHRALPSGVLIVAASPRVDHVLDIAGVLHVVRPAPAEDPPGASP